MLGFQIFLNSIWRSQLLNSNVGRPQKKNFVVICEDLYSLSGGFPEINVDKKKVWVDDPTELMQKVGNILAIVRFEVEAIGQNDHVIYLPN